MGSNERIRKYLDAGTVLGQVSRGRTEEIVRELANAGDVRRSQAQEWVDGVWERSRRTSGQVLETVRHEVAAPLGRIDGRALESVVDQLGEVLKKSAEAGRKTTRDVTTHAGRTATAVRLRAGSTATAARTQAAKTATRARAAAGQAVPARRRAAGGSPRGPQATPAPPTGAGASAQRPGQAPKKTPDEKAAS